MPVYDQSYRRYEARAALRRTRFWPITREALRLVLSRRAFLLLLMAAWVPFLGHVAYVYVTTQFPEAGRVAPIDGQLFARFFEWQKYFVILLTIFGGAGLMADDLRTGAILVYLSRPLTRRDYVIGKLSVLMALNLSVTLVPALLFYVAAAALAPDKLLTPELARVPLALVGQALLVSATYSLVGLALSALSRSARVAGLALFGLLTGLELVRLVLTEAFDLPLAALLSLQANLSRVADALFGVESGAAVTWWAALLVLAAAGAVALGAIRSRVRAVEIVT